MLGGVARGELEMNYQELFTYCFDFLDLKRTLERYTNMSLIKSNSISPCTVGQ